MRGRRLAQPSWLVIPLLMALLASGCGTLRGEVSDGWQLPDDGPSPTVSRDAALSLLRKGLTAGQQATNTQILSLTVTDAEITSFLNIRREFTQELEGIDLDQLTQIEGLEGLEGLAVDTLDIEAARRLLGPQGDANGLRLPGLRAGIREPAVYFRADGQVISRGEIGLLRWSLPVRVAFAPAAVDGRLALNFVEGQIGHVVMPAFVFNLLDRGLGDVLLVGQQHAQITEVSVTQGNLTIRGRYRMN